MHGAIGAGGFKSAASETRFNIVFHATLPSTERTSKGTTWRTPEGRRAAVIEKRGSQTAITFDEKRVPEFAAFVAARLDALYSEFAGDEGETEEK